MSSKRAMLHFLCVICSCGGMIAMQIMQAQPKVVALQSLLHRHSVMHCVLRGTGLNIIQGQVQPKRAVRVLLVPNPSLLGHLLHARLTAMDFPPRTPHGRALLQLRKLARLFAVSRRQTCTLHDRQERISSTGIMT